MLAVPVENLNKPNVSKLSQEKLCMITFFANAAASITISKNRRNTRFANPGTNQSVYS